MSDARMPMIAPTRETYCTADGTPYRVGAGTLVHVQTGHVAELRVRGFRLVPSNWAVTPPPEPAPATDAHEGPTEPAPPTPKPPTRARRRQA